MFSNKMYLRGLAQLLHGPGVWINRMEKEENSSKEGLEKGSEKQDNNGWSNTLALCKIILLGIGYVIPVRAGIQNH
jgi:hypothetical protein